MPNSSFLMVSPWPSAASAMVGAPKFIPRALAAVARKQHMKGEPFKIRVLTGGASGVDIDEALARAITWRAPYQSTATLRKQTNKCANGVGPRQEFAYIGEITTFPHSSGLKTLFLASKRPV